MPVQITTKYSVSIGQVVWDVVAGADYYTVKGETQQGSVASCITNDTYCVLYNLDCGQLYSLSVTANNQVCVGVDTSNETVTITTGEKTVRVSCFSLSNTVVNIIGKPLETLADSFSAHRTLPAQQCGDQCSVSDWNWNCVMGAQLWSSELHGQSCWAWWPLSVLHHQWNLLQHRRSPLWSCILH